MQVVPRTTSSFGAVHTSSNSSAGFSHRAPNSLPADTVGFFKQLADMLQDNNFSRVLPPQVQLDEQTINDYEQVLRKGLAGDLRELGKGSKYQEFNKVLTALLACRRIPPTLQQQFLYLHHDLPSLATRALELNKKVTECMLQKIAKSKIEELENYVEKYYEFEESLIRLEQERESNLSEIVRLQARNKVIDAEIIKLNSEAEELEKISASHSHEIANLKAVKAIDEAAFRSSMDALCDLEFEWRNRVAMLNY